MTFFDKLAFWRKKDDDTRLDSFDIPEFGAKTNDFGLGKNRLGLDEESPFGDHPTLGLEPLPSHLQEPGTPVQQTAGTVNRDLELLNSKLDTVKAILSSMDQRMANLEQAAGVQQKQQRLW